ncbi:putative four-helix membrane protein [Alteromonas sp. CYL-A6]|uniref:putative four-helix membrane protein n=1 Tax=Alteromonas nitratireducens TaxID=3390813 RepID=UPI0034BCADB3
MKRTFSIFLTLISPFAIADRYALNDKFDDFPSGGSDPILTFLGAVLCICLSYYFLFSSYVEWCERRENGEKVKRESLLYDLFFPLVVYALATFFIAAPFLIVATWLGGQDLVNEHGFEFGVSIFAVLTFLRQT